MGLYFVDTGIVTVGRFPLGFGAIDSGSSSCGSSSKTVWPGALPKPIARMLLSCEMIGKNTGGPDGNGMKKLAQMAPTPQI